MITRKCEACGKSEDITHYADGHKYLNLQEELAKMCHDCARVYRELVEKAEDSEVDRRTAYMHNLRENMVTEVRKKLGIEPHDQIKHAVTLHELLSEWVNEAEIFGSVSEHTQKLFNLLSAIIIRLEEPE